MSNSLSLLGDAAAMSLDVSTYVISIFVEEFKLRNEGARYEPFAAFDAPCLNVIENSV